ncbi:MULTISPECIES: NAD(P)-dependent oxidoreductase [Sphingomonas]|uniref:NAD(P)-dependent oxidoreductase n=1 Tax=Sphingomonas adhaesiva TaxID=28212 RepID=A0A2A4I6G9_9SPHN|nr:MULTISPECIES: NAD(P)-dependent oxidoreductase [Sphingomonas]PCG14089.1 NAD(P)-dependent oxidoreductase [Sphingomonas adhaesiva]PZU76853.1 MAG: NAD(P)-dependent oxidoreductase [Sphingomonas sp.]
MTRLFVFGLGYAARAIAAAAGGAVMATTRDGRDGTIRFDDEAAVRAGVAAATHVLSSVPPEGDADPVLARYGDTLSGKWLGYLSSTGVYGDTGGAWVDEDAPADRGRRANRNAADAAWRALGARVFRLPGIYGPGRSALERVAAGTAQRTGVAGQVFSRVHVADIAAGVVAGFAAPPGVYNLADDEPAPQDDVLAFAAQLLGLPAPRVVPLSDLSPAARAFHLENRRVANGRARRVLGWRPLYPDYRAGLRALSATTSPMPASTPPATASGDQR